jgi:hypothetical protein
VTTKPQLYLYTVSDLCFGCCGPQIIRTLISFFHIQNCLIWSTIFYDVWNKPGEFGLRKTINLTELMISVINCLMMRGATVNIHEENCVIQLPTSQNVQTNIHQRSLSKKAQSQLQWTLSKRKILLCIFLVQRISTLKYNTSDQGIIFLMPSYYRQSVFLGISTSFK